MRTNRTRRIAELVAAIAGCDAAAIKPETKLFTDLGFDSAAALELLVTLEDEFDIHIRTDDARAVSTFKHLVRLVEAAA